MTYMQPANVNRDNSPRRHARLSSVVADRIQADVLARSMKAGDKLPTEAALAAEHDVSRAVIREAGRILDQRGLVDIRPGRGMVVRRPDGAEVVEHFSLMLGMNSATFAQLMETRVVIEVEVASLAAERCTPQHIARLRETIDTARRNADNFDVCLAEDLKFHELVTNACDNPFFAMLIDPINTCLRRSYTDAERYLAAQHSTLAEHEAIVNALENHDAAAARVAAKAHLNRVVQQRDSLMPPS